MKKIMVCAMVVALVVLSRPAHANVVIATNTVTYNGIVDGSPDPAYLLNITYDVTFDSGLYTYNYLLSTAPAEDIYAFALGGAPDPINTTGLTITSYGGGSLADSGFDSDSVVWEWGFNSGVTTADVSFTSPIGPEYATFTLNDDDIAWTSPASIPAPVPEPSSFALISACAFVYGLFKYRKAIKRNSKKALVLKRVSREMV